MHVEKNVCDILIETLMNIQENTKHGNNFSLDMVVMGIR